MIRKVLFSTYYKTVYLIQEQANPSKIYFRSYGGLHLCFDTDIHFTLRATKIYYISYIKQYLFLIITCGQTFISNDALERHIKINQTDDHENRKGSPSENSDSISNVKECSLCEDRFPTNEEFKIHVANNLTDIQEIDIEYLKNGHEIFVCNNCSLESNNAIYKNKKIKKKSPSRTYSQTKSNKTD